MHDENKEQKRRDLKTLRLSRFVKGRLDLLGNLSVLVLDPSDQQLWNLNKRNCIKKQRDLRRRKMFYFLKIHL